MKFKIIGCRKDTGEDVQFQIEAPNAQWAERMAQQKGILTSSVEPVAAPAAKPAQPAGPVPVAKRVAPRPSVAPPTPPPPPPQEEEVELEEDLVPLTDIPEEQLGGAEVQPVYTGPVVVEKEDDERPARSFSVGLPPGLAGPLFSLIGVFAFAGVLWVFNKQDPPPIASFALFKSHAPPGSHLMIYVDIARLRTTPVYEDFEEQLEALFEESPIALHQVDQVMYAFYPDEKVTLILKTINDLHPSDLTGVEGRTTTHQGITYTENRVDEGGEWIARVARQLYVITTHEDLMQKAIEAGRTGGGGRSTADLERVASYVGGADHVAVIDGARFQEKSETAKGLKAAGVGLSISGNVELKTSLVCDSTESADKAMLLLETIKGGAAPAATLPTDVPVKPDQLSSAMTPQAKRMLSALKISRDGATVRFSAAWPYEEVRALVESDMIQRLMLGLALGNGDEE